MAEIRKQALQNLENPYGLYPTDHHIGLVRTWESFIESLLREWKTFNIVSALMLSAILTILQIEAAASDPIIRYSALLSMICALMSLLYGCMYIIRFGSMKRAHKAAEWADEAQSTKTNIFWNVWVLLAMPATWLAWSIILYITCVATFVWRTGPGGDAGPPSTSNPLWPRVVISAVLGLGLIYFVLIIATLRRYGDAMDRSWRMRVQRWARSQYPSNMYNGYYEPQKRDRSGTPSPWGKVPSVITNGSCSFQV
ncbi:hypothetical protein BDQ17DRAFT_1251443 [Cyathus striatus]|nr:hypothetical protein BDQ17DRAFT_1251443 [Cyathus striatus]